ncbi:sulfatase family protein [Lutibacter citreus]|uniref:sulfatase family protein n=1 Tax=Lutibacter citreus TaxID=2138210 RepID=UPI000DBE130B|nr:arylsulfatase [Lutibacter citreus]
MKKSIIILFLGIFCVLSCKSPSKEEQEKPNVIIIYTDDVGYGDIGAYGAKLIKTPNIDKLAEEGIRFTDGHCAASTCSPSRYSLLTGDMGFRKDIGIQGINGKLAIDTKKFTLPKLFKKAGYSTAVVGKWHLGLGDGNVDWNKEISPGPLDIGFDYNFLVPATNDRSPFVYVENRKVYNHNAQDPITVTKRGKRIPDSVPGTKYPEAKLNPEAITLYNGDDQHSGSVINGVGRIGYMKGGKEAMWDDYNMPKVILEKATKFVEKNKEKPFFLFLTSCDIHAPRMPHPRFQGTTTLGMRGDNVVQLDWFVGEVMTMLKKQNIDENTMVIFTSDNGPVIIDGYQDGSIEGGHKPAGIYSGGKYGIEEGGTRVPFIVHWPSQIDTKVSDALVSQVDFMASFGEFLNIDIPKNEAADSRAYWKTFIGKEDKGTDMILEQDNRGYNLALRLGDMKYTKMKGGSYEMYDLKLDPEEKNNIINKYSEKAEELDTLLAKYIEFPLNHK